MKITCIIVHMIYNCLSLEKVRIIKECSRITYSKSMPHPSRTMYGFSDEFHFSKSFKNKFGISPKNYRLKE